MAAGTLTGTTIAATYTSLLKLGTNSSGTGDAINVTGIVASLTKAIQELSAEVEKLKNG